MKVAIISTGSMGDSITYGPAEDKLISTSDIIVSNPSAGKLEALKKEFPSITTTRNNAEAAIGADVVVLTIKLWLIRSILRGMKLKSRQILASVTVGISFEQLVHDVVEPEMPMFRTAPNTAINELQSMTLIASRNTGHDLETLMINLFGEMGMTMILPENKLEAATALTSCGIAYVLKYVRVAIQADIEMRIRPSDAMDMVAQSVKEVVELILNNDTHPSVEVDKVTTPGGITIEGINELEHDRFTSTIIKAMKASR